MEFPTDEPVMLGCSLSRTAMDIARSMTDVYPNHLRAVFPLHSG